MSSKAEIRPRLTQKEYDLVQKIRASNKNEQALIIPDCHIPFEDEKAYQLMLDVAQDIQPKEIVILGDYADFMDVSSHSKDVSMKTDLRTEIKAVIARLDELRKLFPLAKIVYIEGNHEFRMPRYVRDKAKELFGIVDVPMLLELERNDIEFVEYGPNQQYSVMDTKLIARHEPLAGGTHVAHNTVVKAMQSVIFGHTHRIQESQIVGMDGSNYRGISSGWLGDVKSNAFNYVKNHHQWASGFSVVTKVDDKTWFNQLIHIINYKCQFNGVIYES